MPKSFEAESVTNEPRIQGNVMGNIRITKVIHEFHPIQQTEKGVEHSIGAIIDKHIFNTLEKGGEISEISLFFETDKQREDLAAFYLGYKTAK